MPLNPKSPDHSGLPNDESDGDESRDPNLETDEETIKRREIEDAKERKLRMLKKYCCKSYVLIFHRDKAKPKLSCS